MPSQPKRIGIYSGSFDPVHSGHISFALQALEAAQLDELYFMPERRPLAKPGVVHYAHRVGMLNQALVPYKKLKVLEMVDINFTVQRTLPRLQERFKSAQLVFLFGSDAFLTLPGWPHARHLLETAELVVGLRADQPLQAVQTAVEQLSIQPSAVTIVNSYAPHVSSTQIREALRTGGSAKGSLPSVARYSNRHWLYVSVV